MLENSARISGDWDNIRRLVTNMVARIPISADDNHVALATFGSITEIKFNFGTYFVDSFMITNINGMPYRLAQPLLW